MLNRMMIFSLLALLAGCAGTKQAGVEPVAPPAAGTTAATAGVEPPATDSGPVAAASVPAASVPDPLPAFTVADATPASGAEAPARIDPEMHYPDPYRCMLAWAKGVQDAWQPMTHAVKSCEARPATP